MNERISKIENDVQDRNSFAWKKLCEYVDKVEMENREEFSPLEELGQELFTQIYTLPESISKLKKVKKVWLYGSKIKRLPPEIGEMESLEYFDSYTSYDLHWFPFEITNCKKLKDSRVSTRSLYGNYKNRKEFSSLTNKSIRYLYKTVKCSFCKKELSYSEINQVWITLLVGTDVLPLLTNLCSVECENKLPKPPENYIQFPHKGGADLNQPLDEDDLFEMEMQELEKTENNVKIKSDIEVPNQHKEVKLLKLIRKIWKC